jgi:hypothetical protein
VNETLPDQLALFSEAEGLQTGAVAEPAVRKLPVEALQWGALVCFALPQAALLMSN